MTIPASELNEIEASLNQWRTPTESSEIVEALLHRVPSKILWGPKFRFLRESINAADFSLALGGEHVRLVEKAREHPDFEIRSGGIVRGYVTEAQTVGRRRGSEDWESNVIEFDPVENWIARAAMVPGQLRKAVKNKVGRYTPNTSALAVYLNIGTYGEGQKEIVADFHDATALAKDEFTEVWVFWGGNFYLLWRDGKHSSRVVQAHMQNDDADNSTPGAAYEALFGDSYDRQLFRN